MRHDAAFLGGALRIKKSLLLLVAAAAVLSFGFQSGQGVRDLTPAEAYRMMQESSVFLVDVRSVAEYVFVGHPENAYNIPLMFWEEKRQEMVPNPHFLQDLEARFEKEDVLIFICRSGGRSRKAAEVARDAGFERVFNIMEGFEGEKGPQGHRTVNGWKNAELPYTYEMKEPFAYRKNLRRKQKIRPITR